MARGAAVGAAALSGVPLPRGALRRNSMCTISTCPMVLGVCLRLRLSKVTHYWPSMPRRHTPPSTSIALCAWTASSSRCRRCLWRSSWPCRLRLRVRLLEPTLSHAAKPARRRHGLLIRREQSKQLEFLARREQRALFDRPHRSRRAARSAEGSHWPNFGTISLPANIVSDISIPN